MNAICERAAGTLRRDSWTGSSVLGERDLAWVL